FTVTSCPCKLYTIHRPVDRLDFNYPIQRAKVQSSFSRSVRRVIINALRSWPPLRYILAVEQESTAQSTIVKRISRALGTGKVKKIPQEEAFLLPDVTQQIYDQMTLNLNAEPEYIADQITWHQDSPFRDNIDAVVKEFRTARGLHPLKIIVLGPPASGKSIVARYLADYYGVHYVHAKSLIEETVQTLVRRKYFAVPLFSERFPICSRSAQHCLRKHSASPA
ncbi:adenylate kinase 7-like, partial [Megalopta genalis]|uniref:adenylate kinase 7-like n=1 Tax=Megalopta genalis TaxID=115081 RepID=UPI003FD3EEF9